MAMSILRALARLRVAGAEALAALRVRLSDWWRPAPWPAALTDEQRAAAIAMTWQLPAAYARTWPADLMKARHTLAQAQRIYLAEHRAGLPRTPALRRLRASRSAVLMRRTA